MPVSKNRLKKNGKRRKKKSSREEWAVAQIASRSSQYTYGKNRLNTMHREMLSKLGRGKKVALLLSYDQNDRHLQSLLRKEIETYWRRGEHYPGWSSYHKIKPAA